MQQSQALQLLQQKIATCRLCQELAEYRDANNYKTVPGVGNPNARIFVIGEAPGENEAKEGEPFVGKAGKLLNNIFQAAGWQREELFIANILKCRPPGNRDPQPQEAANCRKFLDMQIRCVNPEWILCFGRISSIYLLGKEPTTTIGSLRHEIHEYEGKKVICTYHPSYLLRNPAAKTDVWDDLQPVIAALQAKVSAL
jgi:uracil-DNA glycosylase family 4